jgi:hypothetical protein
LESKTVGKVFGAIGIIFLIITLIFIVGNLSDGSSNPATTGTVNSLEPTNQKNTSQAVIVFTDAGGKRIQFSTSVDTNASEFQVGKTVRVYYNSEYPPYSAKPDFIFSSWFRPILFGVLSLIFIGISIGFYRANS